ncbi:hypothetical protein [Calderihabitans maritimus]|uniref:HepT-like domain-containing protein n=1 Tax=Calderihabitans maritimus TaxID=1246530 RepID=A0A1Z5HX57_9FIRM|nr:hypothetical protein [Calderihabitans maritimus]GAW94094.1 hypothetical protein Desku_3405 [Calderihabitans maritimus]
MSPDLMVMEARIRKELSQLQKLEKELAGILKAGETKMESVRLRAYASILHDFYSGIEKIFITIAREIDQSIPTGEGWHRQLLEQMTLDLPTKRPAVIDAKFAAQLQEYLSFRHRFRNLYGYELQWLKMEDLVKNMGPVLKDFKIYIEKFLGVLSDIMK